MVAGIYESDMYQALSPTCKWQQRGVGEMTHYNKYKGTLMVAWDENISGVEENKYRAPKAVRQDGFEGDVKKN